MIGKPSVLGLVEKQPHKNDEAILPPIFENIGRCWACGKEKHVNASGFCEECWITHSYLRSGKPRLS